MTSARTNRAPHILVPADPAPGYRRGVRKNDMGCQTVAMGKPGGFSYSQRKNGEVVITHHGRTATVLRGRKAETFLTKVAESDGQELMARATGNYKRGNEIR